LSKDGLWFYSTFSEAPLVSKGGCEFWLHFGSTLALLWLYFGSTLAPLWLHFGSTLALLWLHFGSTLAPPFLKVD